jgi:hypothetical protein
VRRRPEKGKTASQLLPGECGNSKTFDGVVGLMSRFRNCIGVARLSCQRSGPLGILRSKSASARNFDDLIGGSEDLISANG